MLLERLHKRLHASSSKRSQENKDKGCTLDGTLPVQPEPQHQNHNQEPQPLLNYDYDDMIAFDRNVSTPVFTPVMTPINNGSSNQSKHSANSYFPPFLNNSNSNNRTRQNSASSLASSVSDFHQSFKQQAVYNSNSQATSFTPQFVGLLIEVYQDTCSDPTITPFDTTNPPSGILNRVAKVAIQQSEVQQLDIGCDRNSWLLTLVRHRLLQEVRKDGYLSRNASLTSLPPPPPPQFAEMLRVPSPFVNADIADPIPLSKINSNPNLNSSLTNTLNWYSSQRSNPPMKSRNGSSQYISELQPQPSLARTNSNSSTSNGNIFSLLTPTPTSDSPFNFNITLLSRQRSNIISSPLASTRLPTTTVTAEDPSMLPSDSLRLKRDLLRLKR
ncbi:hypothetical protein N7582_005689 [Saccharomyces uvarum]|uniref:YPL014W-like protein n=1 Tax=Saccharomyces uvarum TaxID=230603 RepID=A0AA35JAT4_SACUV|nr:hypothetical protein N7582_005689 [Saccharomyces uvarum]CAI4053301.1 hypothetical protein SUVC_16G2590 [Saccharomyces uvarum]